MLHRHSPVTVSRGSPRWNDSLGAKFTRIGARRASISVGTVVAAGGIMKCSSFTAALLVAVPACASQPLVRDDDMSAAQHRSSAEREEAIAAREAGGSAEERRQHARQHEAAAAFLEQFEDEACAGVPHSERAACPLLGPLVRLDDVPGGVRATFVDPARVPDAIAEMRCHYAFARARHFDEKIGCPLYVGGIEIRRGLDARTVEIVAHDDRTVRLIRERSRVQAIVVRRDR
jgi:hypothetical protein